jgi:hypothetical protein
MAHEVRPGVGGAAVSEPGGLAAAGSMSAAGDAAEPAPFVSQVPGTPTYFPSYHGRPVSWFAVTLIMVGFLAGGFALIFGPTWVVFWIGVGLAVLGGLVAAATNIMDDWY